MGTVDEQLLDYWSSASQYVTDFRFKANVTPLAFWELAIGSSILYLVTIYLLRKYMETREKYEIRVFAMLHNFNMFAISVFCWLGLTYGFLKAFYVRPRPLPPFFLALYLILRMLIRTGGHPYSRGDVS